MTMKKHTLLGTILAATIVAAGSVALAQAQQTPGAAPGSPATPGTETMPKEAKPMTPGGAAGAMSQPAEEVVGKSVTNVEGEDIGKISEIVGSQVIVAVGGFLGIGARDVALDWSQITPTGMGDEMKLQTTLTKAELEAMPEYKK
jgi:hypothetical protein